MHRGELIARLRGGGLDPIAEDIADAVWLAQWLPDGRHPGPAGDAAAPPDPGAGDPPARHDAEPVGGPDDDPCATGDHLSGLPAPTASSASIGLHLPGEPGSAAGPGGTVFPVRAPAATALPGLLGLQRALRPLRHYNASPAHPADARLDEEATADRSARTGALTPVWRPARHRRVDIQLLMDTGPAMIVWERMVEELRQACQQSGVFRDVQVHQLYDTGDGPPLVGTTSGPGQRTRLRSADQFHDPVGRRLTLVVSDCVGPLWQRGAAQELLHSWPRNSPLAVVQPLPPRLWGRTALPVEPGVLVRAPEPGGRLRFHPDDEPWDTADDIPRPVPVPVLQPTPEAFEAWARLLSGHGGAGVRAWAAWAGPVGPGSAAAPAPPVGRTDEELLRAFRASASTGAVRLAVYFAAAPLVLPVMQLVQRAMLPDTGPMELAEVLLGGLLRQLPGTDERPCFVYPGRVQELLLGSLDRDTASLVLKHCSAYVERHFGRGTRNFAALAAARLAGQETQPAPADHDDAVDETAAGVEAELFARIPARVLRHYQPDLVTPVPLAEAERLFGQWRSQADPTLLRRARDRAEEALRAPGADPSAPAELFDSVDSSEGGIRARIVLGRILRAESGTASVRDTGRHTDLLRQAAAALGAAMAAAPHHSELRIDAGLELAVVHYDLWRATGVHAELETALAALAGEIADIPRTRRRSLLLRRGRLLLALGRAAEAAGELRDACTLLDAEGAPDSVRCAALLDLADALGAAGADPDETRAALARAKEAATDDAGLLLRCHIAQARHLESTGDHLSADGAYEAAARLSPDDGGRRFELLADWGQSLLRRAATEDGAAAVDRAENVLREALTAVPARSVERARLQALVGSALAHRFRHLGFLPDLFESRHLLWQAVRAAPDEHIRAESWLQLGRVRLELRRRAGAPGFSEALQAYRNAEQDARAAAQGGENGSVTAARALHGQGAVLELMGRTAAARGAYRSAAAEWRRLTGALREVDWREVESTRGRAARLDAQEQTAVTGAPLSDDDWDRLSPPWPPWQEARPA